MRNERVRRAGLSGGRAIFGGGGVVAIMVAPVTGPKSAIGTEDGEPAIDGDIATRNP